MLLPSVAMMNTEVSLLHSAIDGNPEALSSLLHAHGAAVQRKLRIDKAWQRHVDKSDVMQVTFIEAFRRIRNFDRDRPDLFESWLRQIAENNVRDAIRGLARHKRGGPGHRRELETETNLELAADNVTPSRDARRGERAVQLNTALTRLPPDYATVVRLADLEGLSVTDVADRMKRSAGAVHMLRARAHDRLRELLGPASAFLSNV